MSLNVGKSTSNLQCVLPGTKCKTKGFDIDFMTAIATLMQVDVQFVSFTNNSYDEVKSDLTQGRYDVTSPRITPLLTRIGKDITTGRTVVAVRSRIIDQDVVLLFNINALELINQFFWTKVFAPEVWILTVALASLCHVVRSNDRMFALAATWIAIGVSFLALLLQTFILSTLICRLSIPITSKTQIREAVKAGRFTPTVWEGTSTADKLEETIGAPTSHSFLINRPEDIARTIKENPSFFYVAQQANAGTLAAENPFLIRSVRTYEQTPDFSTCLLLRTTDWLRLQQQMKHFRLHRSQNRSFSKVLPNDWQRRLTHSVNLMRERGMTQAILLRSYKRGSPSQVLSGANTKTLSLDNLRNAFIILIGCNLAVLAFQLMEVIYVKANLVIVSYWFINQHTFLMH